MSCAFLAEVLFQVAAGGELRAGQAGQRIVVAVLGKHVAEIVHDGDVVGLESFDGIGDQKADGIDGLRLELGVAAHADKHRGGGIFVLVEQQPVFRQHDHHARRFDFVELADGAGQFALHGADIIGALHEIGDAEIRLVENFKAHAVAAAECRLPASCIRIR